MATKTAPEAAPGAAAEAKPKKSKKKLLIILVLLLVVGGAAYWFVLKPKPAEAKAPEPGEVVALEPIQVNLAGGHYLKIGIALQLTAKAKEADGSKALDATIGLFSGLPMQEVTKPTQRKQLKEELTKELEHRYDDEVMGVYFTDFVTQ